MITAQDEDGEWIPVHSTPEEESEALEASAKHILGEGSPVEVKP